MKQEPRQRNHKPSLEKNSKTKKYGHSAPLKLGQRSKKLTHDNHMVRREHSNASKFRQLQSSADFYTEVVLELSLRLGWIDLPRPSPYRKDRSMVTPCREE
ncbi:unnamed protein product [Anisakis simplex]|uniref:Small vasohibin-binding protein n=1 Tax=Anisakis simplex TaxID=6269 RepID=A0A0M3JUL0_ANISI|nr:unnamed protein product [Anisakis simplex]